MQRCFWQPWLNWGRAFRSAIACHIWDSSKRIHPALKSLEILRYYCHQSLKNASESQLARNPNPNSPAVPPASPSTPKAGSRPAAPEGRQGGGVTLVRGIRSGHSTPTASQLSGHTVGKLCAGVWKSGIMLWEIHSQEVQQTIKEIWFLSSNATAWLTVISMAQFAK